MDNVSLVIGSTKITNFISFKIDADLYTSDHAFSIELAEPQSIVKPGVQCKLYVNNELVLTGITDRVTKSYDKEDIRLSVEGRDLMGLLVDSYCGKFLTLKGITLQALAENLLATVPFINKSQIQYQSALIAQSSNKGSAPASSSASSSTGAIDTPQAYAQVEPGMRIFDVLNNYARSRGFMFFSLPDGTMIFGRPKAMGAAAFSLTCARPGPQNNVLQGEECNDYSKRYSQVSVIGQQQGQNSISPSAINTSAVVTDPTFPFFKPYVATDNNDAQSPLLHARAIMEKMKHDGYTLNYKMSGMTQSGRAWTVNELCRVRDDVIGIRGTYLIFGRTLEMGRTSHGGTGSSTSVSDGIVTTVRLGPPGLVA